MPHSSPRHVLAALVLAALPLGSARAEEPVDRLLAWPGEGFSLRVHSAWAISQPAEALLELKQGARSSLWVRRDTGSSDDLAGRLRALAQRHAGDAAQGQTPPEPEAWEVTGAAEAWRIVLPGSERRRQGFALVRQPRGLRLEIEWTEATHDAQVPASVKSLLQTLDVTAFEHARRFVDLSAGWSLDVPHGWKRRLEPGGRTVFASPEQPPTLLAVRAAAAQPSEFDAEGLTLWKEVLRLPLASVTPGPQGGLPDGATRYTVSQFLANAAKADAPGFASTQERSGWWLSLVAPALGRESTQEAETAIPSFRAPAEPGPRVAPAPAVVLGEPQPLPGHAAPAVTFRLPRGWTSGSPSSSMRLAQWTLPPPLPATVPPTEPGECVVFFFGPGGGGSVEANFERWKRQFEIEGAPTTSVEDLAPGVQATFLSVSGRYVAETRPGSGERLDKPGWRLLAAVLTCEGGPLFLKCVGPTSVLDAQAAAFQAWVRSFRPKA